MNLVALGYLMLVVGWIAFVSIAAGPLIGAATLAATGAGLMVASAWANRR